MEITKERKQELIQQHAPNLWKSFQRLDRAKEKAIEEFKKRYGLFWNLKIDKKKLHERQIEISAEWDMEEIKNSVKIKTK